MVSITSCILSAKRGGARTGTFPGMIVDEAGDEMTFAYVGM